jgi:uncharacterized protein (DUF1015 family)
MRIRSLKGLCPTRDSAKKVISLPYDVVSTAEARSLAEAVENFRHLR